jgi:hypothetical protein
MLSLCYACSAFCLLFKLGLRLSNHSLINCSAHSNLPRREKSTRFRSALFHVAVSICALTSNHQLQVFIIWPPNSMLSNFKIKILSLLLKLDGLILVQNINSGILIKCSRPKIRLTKLAIHCQVTTRHLPTGGYPPTSHTVRRISSPQKNEISSLSPVRNFFAGAVTLLNKATPSLLPVPCVAFSKPSVQQIISKATQPTSQRGGEEILSAEWRLEQLAN